MRRHFTPFVLVLFLGAMAVAAAPQPQPDQATSTPVLWRDGGAIADKDLLGGAGGRDSAPEPPFTFVKEDLSGSKPKVRVKDARGIEWNIKFAGDQPQKNEVHAEIAANRFVWALGYAAEQDYLVKSGRIENVGRLERARSSVGRDGSFQMARFERRPSNVTRTGRHWTNDANPFVGTQEFSGLQVIVALVNNWDNKPENTAIDLVTLEDGRVEERYLISDWGASFGRMAGPPQWTPAPTRWHPPHYREQPLVRRADSSGVELNFIGQVALARIPLDHLKWFTGLVAQLRPEQIRAAFEAAGGSPEQVEVFTTHFLDRVRELQAIAASE